MAILVINMGMVLHSSLILGMFFKRSYCFMIIDKTINKSSSQIMSRETVSATMQIGYQIYGPEGHKKGSENRRYWSIRVRVRAAQPHPIFLRIGTPPPLPKYPQTPRVFEALK